MTQIISHFPDLFWAPVEGIAILPQFPFSSGLWRIAIVSQKIGEEQYNMYMKVPPEILRSFCRQNTHVEFLYSHKKSNFIVILTLIKTLIRAYVGAEILKGFPLAPLQLHVCDSSHKQALGSLNDIS